MKAYQDKITGKWKWGKRGEPIYDTAQQARDAGMGILTERLREIRRRLDSITTHGHGV